MGEKTSEHLSERCFLGSGSPGGSAFATQDGPVFRQSQTGDPLVRNAVAIQVASSEDHVPSVSTGANAFLMRTSRACSVERIGEESWGVREVQESEWR